MYANFVFFCLGLHQMTLRGVSWLGVPGAIWVVGIKPQSVMCKASLQPSVLSLQPKCILNIALVCNLYGIVGL